MDRVCLLGNGGVPIFQAQQVPMGCFERQLGKYLGSICDESLGTALTVSKVCNCCDRLGTKRRFSLWVYVHVSISCLSGNQHSQVVSQADQEWSGMTRVIAVLVL